MSKKIRKEQTSMFSFINKKIKEHDNYDDIEIGLEMELSQNSPKGDELFDLRRLVDSDLENQNDEIFTEFFDLNPTVSKIIRKWGLNAITYYNPSSEEPNFSIERDGSLDPNEGFDTTVEFKTPYGIKLKEQLLFFKEFVKLNNEQQNKLMDQNDSCGLHVNLSENGDIDNLNLLVLYELFNEHYYKYQTRMKIPRRDIDDQYKREYNNLVDDNRQRDELKLEDVKFNLFIIRVLEKQFSEVKKIFEVLKESQQEFSDELQSRIESNIISYVEDESYDELMSTNEMINKRFGFPVRSGMLSEIIKDVKNIQNNTPEIKQLFSVFVKNMKNEIKNLTMQDKNQLFYICQQSVLLNINDDELNLNLFDKIDRGKVNNVENKINNIIEKVGKNRKIVNKNFYYQRNIDKLVYERLSLSFADYYDRLLEFDYEDWRDKFLYNDYLKQIRHVTRDKYRSLTIKDSCVEFRIMGGDYLKPETYKYIQNLQKIFMLQISEDKEIITYVEKQQIEKIKKMYGEYRKINDVLGVMDV